MSDERYDAMRHAVDLALTGQCNNWWCVAARLRAKRYQQDVLDWTAGQREWLDRLCAEAGGRRLQFQRAKTIRLSRSAGAIERRFVDFLSAWIISVNCSHLRAIGEWDAPSIADNGNAAP